MSLDSRDRQGLLCCPALHSGSLICVRAAQRAARRWMLERERAVGALAHPTWRAFVTRGGLPIWLCAATGDATSAPPPAVRDTRGGFFCDEPVRTRVP